ncbi:hypothetical protein BG015_005962, partial [Linnemannia schmuckeri]
ACMYFVCQLLGACLGVAMARGNTPGNVKLGVINYLHRAEASAAPGDTVKVDVIDGHKNAVGSSTGNQVAPTTGGEAYRRA